MAFKSNTTFHDWCNKNKKTILLKEWNDKNCSPKEIAPFSNKKISWICSKCKKEWIATINSRSQGAGCRECGKKLRAKSRYLTLISQKTSLLQANPSICAEWDYEKNIPLKPEDLLPNSNKKVYWKCTHGHSWMATIASRNNGCGCPECKKESKTSYPEQAIFYYVKKMFPDAINRKIIEGYEFDVYIEELNIAIEYDGQKYHQNKDKDLQKQNFSNQMGIELIRVRENNCPNLENCCNVFVRKDLSKKSLEDAIYFIFDKILKHTDKSIPQINLKKDDVEINKYLSSEKTNSLQSINNYLLDEWNFVKNGDLSPKSICAKSNRNVWWICKKCQHEWKTSPNARISGNGCPACAGKIVIAGKNDLSSLYPKIASEWNYNKNNEVPENISYGTDKKYWWICNICKNEWLASPGHRTQGKGCPKCANKKRCDKKRDNRLIVVNPKLINELHPTKNNLLNINQITAGSSKEVVWICPYCNKEWTSSINEKNRGKKCPYCRY